jgi:hypothetical protein
MTWADVETAVVQWVKSSTGLGDAAIVLGHQNGPSPFPGPGAQVYFGDFVSEGAADDLTWDFDAGRPAGAEIVFTSTGWRTVSCTVNFFSPGTTGNSTARTLAQQAQSGVRLPSARSALNAAGIGVMDEGHVRWVPVQDSGVWYGMAVLEVKLLLRATATEAVGYIATVVPTTTVT